MATTYIGVDPGEHGAIALLFPSERFECHKIPQQDPQELWSEVQYRLKLARGTNYTNRVVIVIEQVSGYTGKKKGGQPGSSMFNFGFGYGKLVMAFVAAGARPLSVTPQKWQKALGVPTRDKKAGETHQEHKRKLWDLAKEHFGEEVFKWQADALLLALYAAKTYGSSR